MPDVFSDYRPALDSPCNFAAAVTPDDNTDLTTSSRALWVGGGGAIALVTAGGSTVTIAAVPAGSLVPLRVARVKATGTTATSIIALW